MKTQWAIAVIPAALICTAALSVPARAEPDHAALMKQALGKVNEKAWADAETLYDQAIVLDAKEPYAWLMRGFVRAVQNYSDDAVSDDSAFLVRISLQGDDMRPRAIGYANRADVWNRRQEPLRALVDAVAACAIDPAYARAWLARADAQYLLGDLAEANNCLEKARPLPGFVARPYTADGAKQNATQHKPINDAADISAAFAAVVTASQSGEWRKALEGYGAVIATKPMSGDAWGNRGILQYQKKADADAISDYSSAITAYELGSDTKNQARNLLNRAGALSRQSKLREAISDLELALRLTPGDARITSLLESTRRQLAETPAETLQTLARAKSLIEKAKKFNGALTQQNTTCDEVIALLDKAAKEQPDNAQFYYLRGVAEEISFHILGSNQKAVPFYDKAIAINPQFADAYLRRGNVLLDQFSPPPKDREKGWADRSQAIALGIQDARLFAARAEERGSENIDGALSDIEKALAMEPKNPAYLKQRDALLKLKRK